MWGYTRIYKRKQGYTWVYIGYTRVCRGILGFTGVYNGIHGVQEYAWVYMGIQGYARVYRGIQGYRRVCKGEAHVTKACASAFYYQYNIQHIRKYLSRESTERLVHAFITSRLDYCNGLLNGAPDYQIKRLQRVMKASARLVYRAPKYCHITPLLRNLHWLPVRLRVDFKILLVTFKILHGVAPSYLKDLVSVLPDSHYQLRRNNNGILLERPRLRTKETMGDRAFSIAAPFLWNSLPLPIRQETSIDSFKRSVKTYLFKKAFS